MTSFFRLASSGRIARSALRVAIVVGSVLNLVNQGDALLSGSGIDFFHLLLNFIVPYCVATYSAVKNEMTRNSNEQ